MTQFEQEESFHTFRGREVRPDYEYILISGTALYPISGLKYREAVPKLR
jgi:hypothetical protein